MYPMTNQPKTETLPMALLDQAGPFLDIYTINGKPFTGIATAYHSNLENPFDLSKFKTRTTFKQGRKNGPIEWFYKNGQLGSRGKLKNGVPNGLWEYYYENGKLWMRGNYKNGEKDGPWEGFHDNGQLSWIGNYKNNKLEGPWEYF